MATLEGGTVLSQPQPGGLFVENHLFMAEELRTGVRRRRGTSHSPSCLDIPWWSTHHILATTIHIYAFFWHSHHLSLRALNREVSKVNNTQSASTRTGTGTGAGAVGLGSVRAKEESETTNEGSPAHGDGHPGMVSGSARFDMSLTSIARHADAEAE